MTCETLCATRIDEGREGIDWMDCDEIGREAGGTRWGATVVVVGTERRLTISTDSFSLPVALNGCSYDRSALATEHGEEEWYFSVDGGLGDLVQHRSLADALAESG